MAGRNLKKGARKSDAKRAEVSPPPALEPNRDPSGNIFPIVGIGSSAGGLEALEQFLRGVPENSGMGFVIVQHLAPSRKPLMPEILQRSTSMKVVQTKDRTQVEPDHIYIIPPNKDMSILHDVLHLHTPGSSRGLRLPIDYFFRSLAQDRREHSIGVILSGMGTDGVLGVKAIKEVGGLVLVQEPGSAKFNGMPQSAIDTGLADFVGPAADLSKKLLSLLRQLRVALPSAKPSLDAKLESGLEKVIVLLRAHSGNDFSEYKKNTLYRRIERRMNIHQIAKVDHYARFLQENTGELDLLFRELLIGVTSFFRDPEAWDKLKEKVFPALFKKAPKGGRFRAWVAGCSTGEEAYSLAMVFVEALEEAKALGRHTLQIFATDLDRDAVEKTRRGVYPSNIAADVTPKRLRQFFREEDDGTYCISRQIRDMLTVAPHNILFDPPFTKLDVVVCRNVLIYLTPEAQKRLLPVFHYSLNPGGFLFLGSAESVGPFFDLYATVDNKRKIYSRKEVFDRTQPLNASPIFHMPKREPQPQPVANLQTLAEQAVLQNYAPATVLIDAKGNILSISGRTGKYLEPVAGKANWNIFAMAREGLRQELTAAFHRAAKQKGPVTVSRIKVKSDRHDQIIDLTVEYLEKPNSLQGMSLVVFKDVAEEDVQKAGAAKKGPARRGKQPEQDDGDLLRQEVLQLRRELDSTREEMQTAQEEFLTTNEELQSSNEELQSTNEELTTSREEMQSMNEELQSVNAELQTKLDDLTRTTNDMKNLLNSTEIATLFLDNDLNVRRFTPKATRIFRLDPGDAGRSITDFTNDLMYPELVEDARQVLDTLAPVEKEVPAQNNRWFKTRIMPYKTLDNVIDGVVITLSDITEAKHLEAELRRWRSGEGNNEPRR